MLSNWYIRRGRERYWGSEMTEDKIAAYTTLYTVLTTLSKLIAPYTPFMAESIYQNLVRNVDKNAPESVHLCEFPVADEALIDEDLDDGMEYLLKLVALGRACRNKANIKNRQPLSKMLVKADEEGKLSDELLALLADELNVKEIERVTDDSEFVGYSLKPQLKTLGPKYGALLGGIREFFNNCDATAIVKCVEAGDIYKTEIKGTTVEFSKEDLLISTENKSGYVAESAGGITVILDTNLTEELVDEGIARELVSKLQTMRKEAGFDVTDHIAIGYDGEGRVVEVIGNTFKAEITSDVLADSISREIKGYTKEWDVNGEKITLSVDKI